MFQAHAFARGVCSSGYKTHCTLDWDCHSNNIVSEAVILCWMRQHFQIIMNLRRCPLFQFRLRAFDRIMYCSGVWSYIVGAVTTFTFLSIPLLTIWIGVQHALSALTHVHYAYAYICDFCSPTDHRLMVDILPGQCAGAHGLHHQLELN